MTTIFDNQKILVSLIKETKEKIKSEIQEINKVLDLLAQEVPIYVKYYEELESKVKLRRADKNKEIQEISKKNLNTNLKILFKKISQKCHPDKTSDEQLNQYFLEAKAAFEKNEALTLLEVYNKVFNHDLTEESSDQLKQEYINLKQELDNIYNLPTYRIKTYFKNNEITLARELFTQILLSNTKNLEDLLKNLE